MVLLMLYYKNMCSKQAESCSLVFYATFWIWEMCVQNKLKAAFSLFSYFCNTKEKVIYSATFLIRKICVQKKQGLLFSLLSYFCSSETCGLKTSRDCFLVYSATFVIRKQVCSIHAVGCFCNTKNVCSKQARGCFLVY